MNAWQSLRWSKAQKDEPQEVSLIMDWRSPRNLWWIRIVAYFIIITFLNQDIVWAQGGNPVWSKPVSEKLGTVPGPFERGGDCPNFSIPRDVAVTKEAYFPQNPQTRKPANPLTIINIQDAHSSLSAQESITSILDSLVTNYDLKLVAIEGSSGYIDTSILKTFPDESIRKDTAKYLMAEGKMSAGEFFSITSSKPIALYGIEDKGLYQDNVGQFRKVYELNKKIGPDITALSNTLKALQDKIYSEDLKKLESNSVLHQDGKIAFTDRWIFVNNLAKKHGLDYGKYINLTKLVESLKLEKNINFEIANKERDRLIDELSKALPKPQLEDLVLKSLSFKANKISQGEYYIFLEGLAEKNKVDPAPYKNLITYTGYITLYESIDLLEIFTEVKDFEGAIIEKMYISPAQKSLLEISKCVNYIKDLFALKMTNGDFECLENALRQYSPEKIEEFVRTQEKTRKPENPQIREQVDYSLDKIFENIPVAMEFYKTAEKRNDAILANTINAMNAEGQTIAAVITGGYHTKGLTDLLRRKETSYLVILPKFDASKGERPYIAILTNKKAPYEPLLESGQYYLATSAYCAGVEDMVKEINALKITPDDPKFKEEMTALEAKLADALTTFLISSVTRMSVKNEKERAVARNKFYSLRRNKSQSGKMARSMKSLIETWVLAHRNYIEEYKAGLPEGIILISPETLEKLLYDVAFNYLGTDLTAAKEIPEDERIADIRQRLEAIEKRMAEREENKMVLVDIEKAAERVWQMMGERKTYDDSLLPKVLRIQGYNLNDFNDEEIASIKDKVRLAVEEKIKAELEKPIVATKISDNVLPEAVESQPKPLVTLEQQLPEVKPMVVAETPAEKATVKEPGLKGFGTSLKIILVPVIWSAASAVFAGQADIVRGQNFPDLLASMPFDTIIGSMEITAYITPWLAFVLFFALVYRMFNVAMGYKARSLTEITLGLLQPVVGIPLGIKDWITGRPKPAGYAVPPETFEPAIKRKTITGWPGAIPLPVATPEIAPVSQPAAAPIQRKTPVERHAFFTKIFDERLERGEKDKPAILTVKEASVILKDAYKAGGEFSDTTIYKDLENLGDVKVVRKLGDVIGGRNYYFHRSLPLDILISELSRLSGLSTEKVISVLMEQGLIVTVETPAPVLPPEITTEAPPEKQSGTALIVSPVKTDEYKDHREAFLRLIEPFRSRENFARLLGKSDGSSKPRSGVRIGSRNVTLYGHIVAKARVAHPDIAFDISKRDEIQALVDAEVDRLRQKFWDEIIKKLGLDTRKKESEVLLTYEDALPGIEGLSGPFITFKATEYGISELGDDFNELRSAIIYQTGDTVDEIFKGCDYARDRYYYYQGQLWENDVTSWNVFVRVWEITKARSHRLWNRFFAFKSRTKKEVNAAGKVAESVVSDLESAMPKTISSVVPEEEVSAPAIPKTIFDRTLRQKVFRGMLQSAAVLLLSAVVMHITADKAFSPTHSAALTVTPPPAASSVIVAEQEAPAPEKTEAAKVAPKQEVAAPVIASHVVQPEKKASAPKAATAVPKVETVGKDKSRDLKYEKATDMKGGNFWYLSEDKEQGRRLEVREAVVIERGVVKNAGTLFATIGHRSSTDKAGVTKTDRYIKYTNADCVPASLRGKVAVKLASGDEYFVVLDSITIKNGAVSGAPILLTRATDPKPFTGDIAYQVTPMSSLKTIHIENGIREIETRWQNGKRVGIAYMYKDGKGNALVSLSKDFTGPDLDKVTAATSFWPNGRIRTEEIMKGFIDKDGTSLREYAGMKFFVTARKWHNDHGVLVKSESEYRRADFGAIRPLKTYFGLIFDDQFRPILACETKMPNVNTQATKIFLRYTYDESGKATITEHKEFPAEFRNQAAQGRSKILYDALKKSAGERMGKYLSEGDVGNFCSAIYNVLENNLPLSYTTVTPEDLTRVLDGIKVKLDEAIRLQALPADKTGIEIPEEFELYARGIFTPPQCDYLERGHEGIIRALGLATYINLYASDTVGGIDSAPAQKEWDDLVTALNDIKSGKLTGIEKESYLYDLAGKIGSSMRRVHRVQAHVYETKVKMDSGAMERKTVSTIGRGVPTLEEQRSLNEVVGATSILVPGALGNDYVATELKRTMKSFQSLQQLSSDNLNKTASLAKIFEPINGEFYNENGVLKKLGIQSVKTENAVSAYFNNDATGKRLAAEEELAKGMRKAQASYASAHQAIERRYNEIISKYASLGSQKDVQVALQNQQLGASSAQKMGDYAEYGKAAELMVLQQMQESNKISAAIDKLKFTQEQTKELISLQEWSDKVERQFVKDQNAAYFYYNEALSEILPPSLRARMESRMQRQDVALLSKQEGLFNLLTMPNLFYATQYNAPLGKVLEEQDYDKLSGEARIAVDIMKKRIIPGIRQSDTALVMHFIYGDKPTEPGRNDLMGIAFGFVSQHIIPDGNRLVKYSSDWTAPIEIITLDKTAGKWYALYTENNPDITNRGNTFVYDNMQERAKYMIRPIKEEPGKLETVYFEDYDDIGNLTNQRTTAIVNGKEVEIEKVEIKSLAGGSIKVVICLVPQSIEGTSEYQRLMELVGERQAAEIYRKNWFKWDEYIAGLKLPAKAEEKKPVEVKKAPAKKKTDMISSFYSVPASGPMGVALWLGINAVGAIQGEQAPTGNILTGETWPKSWRSASGDLAGGIASNPVLSNGTLTVGLDLNKQRGKPKAGIALTLAEPANLEGRKIRVKVKVPPGFAGGNCIQVYTKSGEGWTWQDSGWNNNAPHAGEAIIEWTVKPQGGYTAAGYDPSQIREIGIVFVLNDRAPPFKGSIDILEVSISGEAEKVTRARRDDVWRKSPREIKSTTSSVITGNSGTSYHYDNNYEYVIGTPRGIQGNFAEVSRRLDEGGDHQRIFLNIGSKNTSGIEYRGDSPVAWKDLRLAATDVVKLVRAANQKGKTLTLVLHDFKIANHRDDRECPGHPGILTNVKNASMLIDRDRELIEAAFRELTDQEKQSITLEFMNEPDNVSSDIDITFVQDINKKGIEMLRTVAPRAPVTLSTGKMMNAGYYTFMLQRGGTFQVHAYSDDNMDKVPGATLAEKFAYIAAYMNVPDGVLIAIGEFPTDDPRVSYEEVLRAAQAAGLEGVWFWRDASQHRFDAGKYRSAVEAVKGKAAPAPAKKPAAVPPQTKPAVPPSKVTPPVPDAKQAPAQPAKPATPPAFSKALIAQSEETAPAPSAEILNELNKLVSPVLAPTWNLTNGLTGYKLEQEGDKTYLYIHAYNDLDNPTRMYVTSPDIPDMKINGRQIWSAYNITSSKVERIDQYGKLIREEVVISDESIRITGEVIGVKAGDDHKITEPGVEFSRSSEESVTDTDGITHAYRTTQYVSPEAPASWREIEVSPGKTAQKVLVLEKLGLSYYLRRELNAENRSEEFASYRWPPLDGTKYIEKTDNVTGETYFYDWETYRTNGKWRVFEKIDKNKKHFTIGYDDLLAPTFRVEAEMKPGAIANLYTVTIDQEGNIDENATINIGERTDFEIPLSHIVNPQDGKAYSHGAYYGNSIFKQYTDADYVDEDLRGRTFTSDMDKRWRSSAELDSSRVKIDVELSQDAKGVTAASSFKIDGEEIAKANDNKISDAVTERYYYEGNKELDRLNRAVNYKTRIQKDIYYDGATIRVAKIIEAPIDTNGNVIEGKSRTFEYDTKTAIILIDKPLMKIGRMIKITEPDGFVSKICYYYKGGALVVTIDRAKGKTTVFIPLGEDGSILSDDTHYFRIYPGAVTPDTVEETTKFRTLHISGDLVEGSEEYMRNVWDAASILGLVFNDAEAARIESEIVDRFRMTTENDYRPFAEEFVSARVAVTKGLEKKIWSEMYNLVKAARNGELESVTARRWSESVLTRFRSMESLSFAELAIARQEPQEWYNNNRYVWNGLMTMIETSGSEDLYDIFAPHIKRVNMGSFEGLDDASGAYYSRSFTVADFNTLGREVDINGNKIIVVDMRNGQFVVNAWSRIRGKVPLNITCIDAFGRKCTFVAQITGNSSLDSLNAEYRGRYAHRISVVPATNDPRYDMDRDPNFMADMVKDLTIESEADLNMFDINVRAEIAPTLSAAILSAEKVALDFSEENALGLAISDIQKARLLHPDANHGREVPMEGVLYYNRTTYNPADGTYKAEDGRNKTYDIRWQMPSQYRRAGVNVIASFIDSYGGVSDVKATTDKDGAIDLKGVECHPSLDFDSSSIVMIEMRFRLPSEQVPLWFLPLLLILASAASYLLLAVSNIYKAVKAYFNKITYERSRRKRAPPTEEPPAAPETVTPVLPVSPAVQPVESLAPVSETPSVPAPGTPKAEVKLPAFAIDPNKLAKDISDGAKNIEKWMGDLKIDFRDRGDQIEDRNVFLPRMRFEEIWDFFDVRKIPRFNLSVTKRASVFFAAIAFSLYLFGWDKAIIILPYLFIPVIFLLPNYNFLNRHKVFVSSMAALGIYVANAALVNGAGLSLYDAGLSLSGLLALATAVWPFIKYFWRITEINTFIKSQTSQLKDVRGRLIDIRGKLEILGGLKRYRRSFEMNEDTDESYIEEPFESVQDERIYRTKSFLSIIDNAVKQIDELAASRKELSIGRLSAVKIVLWGSAIAGFAVINLGIFVSLNGFLVPVSIVILALLANIGYLWVVARVARSIITRKFILFEPAIDMRDIARDKQVYLFTYTGKPLAVLDVWRFLVQMREAAVNVDWAEQERVLGGTVTSSDMLATLQKRLDAGLDGLILNRDTKILRGMFDSRILTNVRKVVSLTRIRVAAWLLLVFGTIGFWMNAVGLHLMAQLFHYVNTGESIWPLTSMYERPFAIVNIGQAVADHFTKDDTWLQTWEVVSNNLEPLGLQFMGYVVLGSITLFFLKYFYYYIGEKAMKYPHENKVPASFFVWNITKTVISALVLFAIPPVLNTTLTQSLGVIPGTFFGIFFGFLFFRSMINIAIGLIARNRYKGIVVEDKLFGEDFAPEKLKDPEIAREIKDSTTSFINTYHNRLTDDEIRLVMTINIVFRQATRGMTRQEIDRLTFHDVERILDKDPQVGLRGRMKYQKLFGRGVIPSGSVYDTFEGQGFLEAIDKTYEILNAQELILRMSGAGFESLKKEFGLPQDLNIWDAQADPALVKLTGNQIRVFLENHPNEMRIIKMFDFMPKGENWVVVVRGDEEQVIDLVQRLTRFRYPFRRLKIIIAGESWDEDTLMLVDRLRKNGLVPGREFCELAPAPARERRQSYTKPGANTFALKPDTTDGAFGLIFDAEDIPDNLMYLKFITGVTEGVGQTRRLGRDIFMKGLNKGRGIAKTASVRAKSRYYSSLAASAASSFTDALSEDDWLAVFRFNFKRGKVLKRHSTYFAEYKLPLLLRLIEKRGRLAASPAVIKLLLKDPEILADNSIDVELLTELYRGLATMPEYGDFATGFINGKTTEDEFIKRMILGEFERLNMPKNGQGRLSQDRNALSHLPWLTGAFFRGEYSSWYAAGWDGFHAIQDTFKPLGGTTGWFCTEPTEEVVWSEIEMGTEDRDNIINEYNRMNKLAAVGAWDEMQVAEDYELGLVLWMNGFNVPNFYTLTSEDPGAATFLTFETRALQTSRWNKGYIIGLLQIVGKGYLFKLIRIKGLGGMINFLVPTLASAIFPLLFRISKVFSVVWWTVYIPIGLIGSAIINGSLGSFGVKIAELTGIDTIATSLQTFVSNAVPIALNFNPEGWGWAVGPVISLAMIIIHAYFTVASIFSGPDDKLGYHTAITMFEEFSDKIARKAALVDMLDAYLAFKEDGSVRNFAVFTDHLTDVHTSILSDKAKKDIIDMTRAGNFVNIEKEKSAIDKAMGDNLVKGYIKKNSAERANIREAIRRAAEEMLESTEHVKSGTIFNRVKMPDGRTVSLSLVSPAYWVMLAGLFLGSVASVAVSWSVISFIGITVTLATAFSAIALGFGYIYINTAPDAEMRAIRAMRYRLAMINMFIPFYHMMYLYGNKIAWSEIGPRLGYWWLTPRAAKIEEEVIKKYLSEIPAKPDFKAKMLSIVTQKKYDIDLALKETKLRLQARLNFAFLATIFYAIAWGIRGDARIFALFARLDEVINRTSLSIGYYDHLVPRIVGIALILVVAGSIVNLVSKIRQWRASEADIPWSRDKIGTGVSQPTPEEPLDNVRRYGNIIAPPLYLLIPAYIAQVVFGSRGNAEFVSTLLDLGISAGVLIGAIGAIVILKKILGRAFAGRAPPTKEVQPFIIDENTTAGSIRQAVDARYEEIKEAVTAEGKPVFNEGYLQSGGKVDRKRIVVKDVPDGLEGVVRPGLEIEICNVPWRAASRKASNLTAYSVNESHRPTKEDRPCIFCNLSKDEILFSVLINGREYIVAVNINPFSEFHILLISAEAAPQDLAGRVEDVALFVKALGPDFEAIFNSPGAAASVLHFHAQITRSKKPIRDDIEKGLIVREGTFTEGTVTESYLSGWPTEAKELSSSDTRSLSEECDKDIAAFKNKNVPFNSLIYTSDDGAVTVINFAGGNARPEDLLQLDPTGTITLGTTEVSGEFMLYDKTLLDDETRFTDQEKAGILLRGLSYATTRGVLKHTNVLRIENNPAIISQFGDVLGRTRENGQTIVTLPNGDTLKLLGVAATILDANESVIEKSVQTGPSELWATTGKKYDHAEINILRQAEIAGKKSWKDYTLIISLEPCDQCAKAIIARGIKKVVLATLEPRTDMTGNGVKALLAAGIDVTIAPQPVQREAIEYYASRAPKQFLSANPVEDIVARVSLPIEVRKTKQDIDSLKSEARHYMDNQTAQTHADRADQYVFEQVVRDILAVSILKDELIPQVCVINANSFDSTLGLREFAKERIPGNIVRWARQARNSDLPFRVVIAGINANIMQVISLMNTESLGLNDAYVMQGLGEGEDITLVPAAEFVRAHLQAEQTIQTEVTVAETAETLLKSGEVLENDFEEQLSPEKVKSRVITNPQEIKALTIALKLELERDAKQRGELQSHIVKTATGECYRIGTTRIPDSLDQNRCFAFKSGSLEIVCFDARSQWDFRDIAFETDGEYYLFSAIDTEKQKVIGHGMLYRPYEDKTGMAQFRYGIHQDYKHQGYGDSVFTITKSAALSGSLFETGINKLKWRTEPGDNLDLTAVASIRSYLIKHLGFNDDLELNINPGIVIGMSLGASEENAAAMREHFAGENVAVKRVKDRQALEKIAADNNAPAIFIDIPSGELNIEAIKDYISAIKEHAEFARGRAEAAKYENLIFKLTGSVGKTELEELQKILEELKAYLTPIAPFSIEELAGLQQKIGMLQLQVKLEASKIAFEKACNSEPMADEAALGGQTFAAVTAESVLISDLYGSTNAAKAPKAIINYVVYGDIFKTDQEVAAHLKAAGYSDESINNMKFINKNGLSYEQLMHRITEATGIGRANIGIRASRQDMLLKEGERPGAEKFLEVQTITVNGKELVAAMNSYQVLLKILTQSKSEGWTLEGLNIPGVSIDTGKGILIYLPPTMPINYGEEIRAFEEAVKLLSMAA